MTAELFTQSRLQDYVDCPYRYWLRYVEHIESPSFQAQPVQEYEKAIERGTIFHRLVHQSLLGVPEEMIARHIDDERVRQWWTRFLHEGLRDLPLRRLPEITLIARLGDVPVAAKLDLLALEPGRIVIVDWKTMRKPAFDRLEARMQTKVYRWVVSQAAAELLKCPVQPEEIKMRYWFAGDPTPEIEFSYSHEEMIADEHEIYGLIQKIKQDEEFRRTDNLSICRVCAYRSISRPEQPMSELSELEDDDLHRMGQSDDLDL